MSETESSGPDEASRRLAGVVRFHLRLGWWSLLLFLSLGFALEVLHGIKAGLYLDVANEPRRHLWTLAHAHGTLLSLVHVGFALTAARLPAWDAPARARASLCLSGALLLMPAGFFLGGVFLHRGDPGLGIFLLPPGALLLFAAVFLTARAAQRASA